VDVRIVAATHRDLGAMMQTGLFRQDLYYRLNVACLRLPPLRERTDDVPLLAKHALLQLAAVYQEPLRTLSPAAIDLLCRYHWPGNVRELVNALEHAMVFASGEQLGAEDMPETVQAAAKCAKGSDGRPPVVTMDAAQRDLVTRALEAAEGNQTRAAELLHIERHRLGRIVKRFGLQHLTRPRP
jgi:DNA-binding NtrC family response regulator